MFYILVCTKPCYLTTGENNVAIGHEAGWKKHQGIIMSLLDIWLSGSDMRRCNGHTQRGWQRFH